MAKKTLNTQKEAADTLRQRHIEIARERHNRINADIYAKLPECKYVIKKDFITYYVASPKYGVKLVYIDPENLHLLQKYNWSLQYSALSEKFKLSTRIYNPETRRRDYVYLHQLISTDGFSRDMRPIDGDYLNCKKDNFKFTDAYYKRHLIEHQQEYDRKRARTIQDCLDQIRRSLIFFSGPDKNSGKVVAIKGIDIIIDYEDIELVNGYTWQLTTGGAFRMSGTKGHAEKLKAFGRVQPSLGVMLLKQAFPPHTQIHHFDGNKRDYRKKNLIATPLHYSTVRRLTQNERVID